MDIFDFMHERFKFKHRPIRIFETFAGIGTQRMALNRLLGKDNVKCVGISEIDKYALMSYEAIHGDLHNYGDITKINGKDLPEIDILTWSFPCQDLSKAGNQKGLKNTRSGLGYEVIRIVDEMEVKPKILLMENVPDLLSEKFKKGWHLMFNEIEKLGYSNYVETLNSKNYGVAQNRERVFMVSILGDYTYTFPKGFELVKKLKDYLENEIDEKYYLSDKLIKTFTDMTDRNGFIRGKTFRPHFKDGKYAYTITTRAGQRPSDNFIIDDRNLKEKLADELIKNNIVENGDVVNHSYTNQSKKENSRLKLEDYIETKSGVMPTLTTRPDVLGVVVEDKREIIGTYQYSKSDNFMKNKSRFNEGKDISDTILTSPKEGVVYNNLRIRKLTPLEAWRLMGVDDDDFFKAEKVVSKTQLYKQAGNAIVVDVLYYIFKNMF